MLGFYSAKGLDGSLFPLNDYNMTIFLTLGSVPECWCPQGDAKSPGSLVIQFPASAALPRLCLFGQINFPESEVSSNAKWDLIKWADVLKTFGSGIGCWQGLALSIPPAPVASLPSPGKLMSERINQQHNN